MPASGGVPKSLTWHPAADRVLGWTPDGKRILFGSARTAYSRFGEMFTVPVEGGVEEKLPLPSGYEASMSRGRPIDRVRAHREGVHDVEAISRRPDHAHLAGASSPTAASRRCRARIPTTSTRCGPATASTSSPTATGR